VHWTWLDWTAIGKHRWVVENAKRILPRPFHHASCRGGKQRLHAISIDRLLLASVFIIASTK
jgi:hypothetical protein